MVHRVRRHGLRAAVLVLIASGCLALGSAAPASARPGCTSEVPLIVLRCDDSTQPVTGPASATVSGGTATVTATGAYTDSDDDPIGFQCSKDGAPFGGCTFPGLTAGQYTVLIRAVDSADLPLQGCDDLLCTTPEVVDYDLTPVQVILTVDAGGGGSGTGGEPDGPPKSSDPETTILRGPVDRITPGSPVTLTRRPKVVLAASEPATFRCAVNARKVPCRNGLNTLKRLKPGPQVFVAQAIDAQGNFDKSPASMTFYVPVNVRAEGGWRQARQRGAYAGDVATTSRRGAVLRVGKVRNVREVRVVAPRSKKLGTIAVRIGNGPWMKVKLKSGKQDRLHVFVLRAGNAKPVSGEIRVKALKVPRGGSVAVDAIVAR